MKNIKYAQVLVYIYTAKEYSGCTWSVYNKFFPRKKEVLKKRNNI